MIETGDSEGYKEIVSIEDLPDSGWVRKLWEEEDFKKAILEATKVGLVKISARWSHGNAWDNWDQKFDGKDKSKTIWVHSKNGMHSQADVPVNVSADWYFQKADGSSDSRHFPEKEAAWYCFWDLDSQNEE